MASLEGTNKNLITREMEGNGIRVEGYLNLCEHESAEAGRSVYHGVVEIIDGRGGIDVSVQILPVVNADETSHKGHFEDDEKAVTELTSRVNLVFETISRAGDENLTEAKRIRALYETSIEMELQQRASMNLMASLLGDDNSDLSALLSALNDAADDTEDDEADDDDNLFGRGLNPLAGLLP